MTKQSERLDPEETSKMISVLCRAELFDCPRAYLKAVRATLLALDYDEDWVEGEFREKLEAYFSDILGESED